MATMEEVRIVPTGEQYAERFSLAVDTVARERRYIGFVEGPSLESTREFIRTILDGAGVQMLAVSSTDGVVGWCDIVRNPRDGFRHVGRLGMAFRNTAVEASGASFSLEPFTPLMELKSSGWSLKYLPPISVR